MKAKDNRHIIKQDITFNQKFIKTKLTKPFGGIVGFFELTKKKKKTITLRMRTQLLCVEIDSSAIGIYINYQIEN